MTTSVAADGLLERRIVFVGGKGGVGKTTTAAALALVAAERGRTCLVVSTDPAHSLGDIFGRSIGNAETTLAPSLTGLEVDPDQAAAAHIASVKERMKTLVHPRLYDEVDRQLDLAAHAPGATEAALVERVAELMALAGERFDLVVFDTAPSGHTVRLLSLPEVMSAWMDGLLRHRERSSRLGAMLGHLGGKPGQGDDLSLIDARADHPRDSPESRINDVLQARRRKFIVARERLLDAAGTAFMLVVNPDRLAILESRRVVDMLARFDLPRVVAHRQPRPAGHRGCFRRVRRRPPGAGTSVSSGDRRGVPDAAAHRHPAPAGRRARRRRFACRRRATALPLTMSPPPAQICLMPGVSAVVARHP